MPRQPLPDRRATWTQRVQIGGQTYYASFGTYPDGRLGEVFVTGKVFGSYTRGILDSMSRAVSVALQCGADPTELGRALRGINFPPNGVVTGSPAVQRCLSVTDWLGQEILHYYSDARNGDTDARCERAVQTCERPDPGTELGEAS